MAASSAALAAVNKLNFSPDFTEVLHVHAKDSTHRLIKGLLVTYKSGKYCDVTLKIGETQKLRAHRVVLASFSRYFEALLGDNWEEGKKDEIEVLGLDEDAVSDLIEFAYSGHVDISKDNVQTLLEAADYLGVEFVKKSCEDFLRNAIDDRTCLGIWQLADLFSLEELNEHAKRYALRHFTGVCEKEEFLCLPYRLLTDLIADEGLCVVIDELIPFEDDREKIVLQAVFRYIEHELHSRKDHFPELLSLVRIPTLSESFLEEVAKYELVQTCCGEEIFEKARKVKAGISKGSQSTDIKWASPRKFADYSAIWGRCFAIGGQGQPETLYFTDKDTVEDMNNDVYVKGMKLWIHHWVRGPVVGALKVYYSNNRETKYGYSTNEAEIHEFHLEENEKIVKIDVQAGWVVDQLTFYTNKKDAHGNRRKFGPYGGNGGGFYCETPAGSYGFLAGVAGAHINHQGQWSITQLQFAWKTFVFPEDPLPPKGRCRADDMLEDYYSDEMTLDDEYPDIPVYDGFLFDYYPD